MPDASWARYALADRHPRYEVVDSPGCTLYAAYRPAREDTYYWRIAAFLMPGARAMGNARLLPHGTGWYERFRPADALANDYHIDRALQRENMGLEAARMLRSSGTAPAGVNDPSVYAIRSGGVELPRAANWLTATEGLRRARVEHPELTRDAMGGRII
jgi:hypothetical protein